MTSRCWHALNPCDTFMLGMDHAMRRDGSPGNVCHILLSFPHGSSLDAAASSLAANELLRSVSSLRLKRPLLRAPRWVFSATKAETLVQELQTQELQLQETADLESWILKHSVDPSREPACGFIKLPELKAGPSLLFFWHHSLCDARGGENLLKFVGSGQGAAPPLFPRPASSAPLKERIARASKMKRVIFEKALGPIARLPLPAAQAAQPRHYKLRLSPQQTKAIDSLSLTLTGGIFPMALNLAASARAFSLTLAELGLPAAPLFIPVPHDMRRYVKEPHLLSNQVSFAFFRLDSSALSSLRSATDSVIEQLHLAVAEGQPQSMLSFLGLIERLPLPLLWRIIEKPARGHPASMYFSDVGASLSTLEHLCGAQVHVATHYPPVLAPPGFTAVWSRFQDCAEITVCYDAAALGATGLNAFIRNLFNELGVSPAWDLKEIATT